jgi:hypothetical protein
MASMTPKGRSRLPLVLAAILGLPVPALAAPQIGNLSPRGLQIGGTTTITVEGADLTPDLRIVLPFPILGQTVRPGATSNRVQMDVTLGDLVPAGMYQLRMANVLGISNSAPIGVDDLVQVPFTDQLKGLPVALHGSLAGTSILRTSFAGKKGQRLVAEVEARRLGSALDPFVELQDSRRVPLAWAQSSAALSGDARLEAILPVDGTYSIELHDALYRAGSPNHFRLKVGDLAYADQVFPLGVQRGQRASVEFVGKVPPGLRVEVQPNSLGEVPVPALRVPAYTGGVPHVVVGEYPEVVEAEQPSGKVQEVAVPAAISGRIGKPEETDRYRLLVQPGQRLRFEVLANRIGSPLDGVLVLRNEAGAQLATNDDRPNTVDPGFEFTAPEGVKALVVELRDLHRRGGPNFIYRLAITPAGQPEFSLTLPTEPHQVPQGGSTVLRVKANRAGYDGPIKLTIPALPPGLTLVGDVIPAGMTDTLLTLSASPGTNLTQLVTRMVGEAVDVKPPLRRTALLPETALTQNQPWLRAEVGLAVTGPAPITVAWDTSEPALPVGYRYSAKVAVARAPKISGAIRLSLVTSQTVPRTQDGRQEDVKRALRVEGTPMIAADQAGGVAPILVPGDLPAQPYDLAIRAELLGGDGKTVLATATTPSRRLTTTPPLVVQLAGTAVEARSGGGPTGKLTGKLTRPTDLKKPVNITLTGLPAGLPAPAVVLPSDKSDFELPVAFPYGSNLGDVPNVKLVATADGPPVLKSSEIPIQLKIVAGDPPPPPPPLVALFEDEPGILALMNEGPGQATLESADRYSGTAALKVTPPQRFRAAIPGWSFKIAEKPGEGQFRYLRFAWKKRGGDNILLQLSAGGKFGPARGMAGPAYRYEAGPGENPLNAAAIYTDKRLPDDWVVVTRDLFADFGSFTLTGIAFTAGNGEYALFDHVYLARSLDDFQRCPAPVAAGKR